MPSIASPRPIRPSLRLAKFVSISHEAQLGGLLDQCDGILTRSPASGYFSRRPPPLDLDSSFTSDPSPFSSPSSARGGFPACFCSSRPPSPAFSSSPRTTDSCDLCNPYPSSPVSPLSPLSPTFSTWTASSSSDVLSSNRPRSPRDDLVDDPAILFEFFSILDRSEPSPGSSTFPSRTTSPLNIVVGTPTLSNPLLSRSTNLRQGSDQESLSTPRSLKPKSKKRENERKFRWTSWLSRTSSSSHATDGGGRGGVKPSQGESGSYPPSRTLTRNPFSRLVMSDSL